MNEGELISYHHKRETREITVLRKRYYVDRLITRRNVRTNVSTSHYQTYSSIFSESVHMHMLLEVIFYMYACRKSPYIRFMNL